MLRIRELRSESGIKQKDLASLLNIPANTFNQYETEKRAPDIETLKKIAAYFDVSTDYLLGVVDEKKPTIVSDDELVEKEMLLLEKFRKVDTATQELVLAALAARFPPKDQEQI